MAEKEYIERNAVVNGLRAAIKKYSDDKSEANIITALIFQRFAKEIEAIPAADVEPVRHGRFRRLTFSGDIIICSECKMAYNIFEVNGAENFDFCPYCGARMDGDTDANGNDNKAPET